MRYLYVIFVLFLNSCQSENKTTEAENEKFAEMSQTYQEM